MANYIFKVTVESTNEGNKFFIDGIDAPNIILEPGIKYIFDQSDSSNSGHPLRFYYDAAKTTAYTSGVTTSILMLMPQQQKNTC